MKRLIIVILIWLVSIPLLLSMFFIRVGTNYQLANPERINNEIVAVLGSLDRSRKLIVTVMECDWYGQPPCLNGQKIVDGTLEVIPVSIESDTLEFVEKTESSLRYRCPAKNRDCFTDKLKINLSYKFDSLNTVYERQLSLILVRNRSLGFSVH